MLWVMHGKECKQDCFEVQVFLVYITQDLIFNMDSVLSFVRKIPRLSRKEVYIDGRFKDV